MIDKGDIQKLVELRRIVRGDLIVEWPHSLDGSPSERDVQLAADLERLLEPDFPARAGEFGALPRIVVRQSGIGPTGPDRVANLRLGQLAVSTAFTGGFQTRSELPMNWIRKHWGPLLDAFDSKPPVSRSFMAFILELELSTQELEATGITVSASELLATYFRLPGPIADAEFRVAREIQERYFVNFGFSTYRNFDAVLEGGPLGVRVASRNVVDRGLRVRIDCNTKVNSFKGKGEISVQRDEIDFMLTLLRKAVDTDLSELMTSVAQ